MSTGDATTDRQHQELIRILNTLIDSMLQGKGRDEVEKTLKSLGQYTVTHFAAEEACMERHRCPVAAANKSAHQSFLKTYADFVTEFEKTGPTSALAMGLKGAVSEWLKNHIIGTDTKLRACLPARG